MARKTKNFKYGAVKRKKKFNVPIESKQARNDSRKQRSNNTQIAYMCQYMHAHQDFATGAYNSSEEAKHEDEQWLHLQAALNELGPHRTVKQWKLAWRDQKRRARLENATMPRISQRSLLVLDIIDKAEANKRNSRESLYELSEDTPIEPSSSYLTLSPWPTIKVFKPDRSPSPELPVSPPSPTIKISISPTMMWSPEPTSPNATKLPTLTVLPLTRSIALPTMDQLAEPSNSTPPVPTIKTEPSNSTSPVPTIKTEPITEPSTDLSTEPSSSAPPAESRPAQPKPSRPQPRVAKRKRVIVKSPMQRLINAQLEMNSLMKKLLFEVRQSNRLNAEQNRILMESIRK